MNTIVAAQTTPIETRWRRAAAILFAAALLSAPVLAQRHAQPRSGSSGGGGGASSRHAPSGGSSDSRPSPSHSSGPSSSAHRDGGSPGPSGPHRPTGSGRYDGGSHHGGYYPHYGHHYYPSFGFGFGYGYGYYSPYYYGYYSPYYYGYSPYYSYYPYYYGYSRPYGYYRPYDYPGGGSPYYDRQDLGAVALKVRPKTAEVYIDGRYVGTAGGFDGFPTYLWLEPGTYRLELVQEGYGNLEREIEVTPAQVLEFKLRLEEGVASRPEVRSERDYDRDDRRDYDQRGYDHDERRDYPPPRRDDGRDDVERGREIPSDARRDAAELVLEVEPEDASVYIDGRFVGTAREVSTSTEPLVVDAGEHRVQVVHPDFETEERAVTVRAGEERLIEVSLRHRD